MDRAAIEKFLSTSALFKTTDASVLGKVSGHFKPKEYSPGTTVFQAGKSADKMGIVFRGQASVLSVNHGTGETSQVESLREGDVAAVIGTVLEGAYQHAVVAQGDLTILEVRREIIQQLLARVPAVGHAMTKLLATKVVKLSILSMRPATAVAAPSPTTCEVGMAPVSQSANPDVIPYVEVSEYTVDPKVLNMVPLRVIREHRLLPLQLRGKVLTVGMVSPRNVSALAAVKRILQSVDIQVVAIAMDDFGASLIRLKPGSKPSGKSASGQTMEEQMTFDADDAERDADKEIRVAGEEVMRVVNRIIAVAIRRQASDIHIETDRNAIRVRLRVSGMLEDWPDFIPGSFSKALVARVKVLAGLDITEKRLPQDGRVGLSIGSREVDLRISTVPASRGEKIVLRVCEASSILRPLEQTFLDSRALQAVRVALNQHSGSIVVAGGTGSGKSSSLYSVLHERIKARPDTNVVTVEDPIEYRLSGTTQIQVNAAVGLGFPQVLRAMLRQDPDVIVVGETRDQETAQMALEAAISGHLLMTSIHANNAISTLQRLESLGCARSLMAQGLSLIVVQRLGARLCATCVTTDSPPPIMVESMAKHRLLETGTQAQLPVPVGCDACDNTGYKGRVAMVEFLKVTDEIRAALMADKSFSEIREMANESRDLVPFRQCASMLMARKLISGADALMAIAH